ncbi:hypothetical protein AB9F35_01865 [Rhizobium leguminosarum]|uniref:hypothetical protein n=1 Tax=Rhizobium leguminosarum TaxID=384 RepID=UPI003F9669AB
MSGIRDVGRFVDYLSCFTTRADLAELLDRQRAGGRNHLSLRFLSSASVTA